MQTGWLSPDGSFYACDTFDHIAVAEEIVDKFYFYSLTNTHADDILMEKGWVHITRNLLGNKSIHIIWDKHLTNIQKDFLSIYMDENADEPVSNSTKINWSYETDPHAFL